MQQRARLNAALSNDSGMVQIHIYAQTHTSQCSTEQ